MSLSTGLWPNRWRMRQWAALAIALIPGLVVLTVFIWRESFILAGQRLFTLSDDATISLAYARTLAEGGGWQWFAGAESVQGITNPLYTLLMVPPHLLGLGVSGVAIWVSIIGIVTVLAAAIAVALLVSRCLYQVPASTANACALVAGGSVPFLYSYVVYPLRGLEVGLLGALLAWMAVCCAFVVDRSKGPASEGVTGASLAVGGLAAIGLWTRMDFMVVLIPVVVVLLAFVRARRCRWRVAAAVLVPAIGAALALVVFQKAYWGTWVPNTFELKVGGYSLVDRLPRGVWSLTKVTPLVGLVGVVVALSWRRFRRSESGWFLLALASSTTGALMAYSVYVGGDSWDGAPFINRYMALCLPVLCGILFVGIGFFFTDTRTGPRWTAVAVGAAAAGLAGLAAGASTPSAAGPWAPFDWTRGGACSALLVTAVIAIAFAARADAARPRLFAAVAIASVAVIGAASLGGWARWLQDGGSFYKVEDQAVVSDAIALSRIVRPGTLVAVAHAGAPIYYGRVSGVDLLGKMDSRIARTAPRGPIYPGHNKWDYGYSVGQLRPDVVWELWRISEREESLLRKWGYTLRCVGEHQAYFLRSSTHVLWSRLGTCAQANPQRI